MIKKILPFILFFCPIIFTQAQSISGNVYRDYNGDAVQDTREPGVYNVTVKAYSSGTTQAGVTATTDANGDYTITGLASGVTYRIEFEWPYDYLFAGVAGNTSVQFVTEGATNADLALSNPGEYNPPNAVNTMQLYTSCFVFGPHDVDLFDDPLVDNTTRDAVILLEYLDGNTAPDLDSAIDATKTTIATHGDVGSVWGLAYDPVGLDLYLASYLKRHSSFGPDGPSAIYKIDLDNGNAISTFFTDGANLGTDPHPPTGTICTDFGGSTTGEFECWLYDIQNDAAGVSESYNLQGKMAWGDIDITEDYQNIVGVNLNNKELYIIEIASGVASKIAIPTPGCSGGDADNWRPQGVAVKDNKVFIGGMCSAETTQDRADLHAYFYAYNLTTGSWENGGSSIFDFDFDDAAGATWGACWEPWLNTSHWTLTPNGNCASSLTKYYQPSISDIEFDNGDMIIGIKDRNGDIVGDDSRPPIHDATDGTGQFSAVTRGYIARADYDPITNMWTLESDGTSGAITTGGDVNGAENGPGEGEYYWGQHQYSADNTTSIKHLQTTWGGLLQIDGYDNVASVSMNPTDNTGEVSDGGIIWLNNDDQTQVTFAGVSNVLTAGTKTRQVRIYDGSGDPALFDKAAGLGDLEASNSIAPIEIGNLVWIDTNENGIQDPDELPVDGVVVDLVLNGVVIASTTTVNGGQFGFSSSPVGGAAGWVYGVGQLVPGANYELVISSVGSGPLTNYTLTSTDTGGSDVSEDLRDNDATGSGNMASISFTTEDYYGRNNHTYDFGFRTCVINPPVISVADNVCPSTTGTFNIDTPCEAGASMEWSTDNGVTWSTTMPVYDEMTSMDVLARCINDADNTCISENSPAVTTMPQECCPERCLPIGVIVTDK